MWNLSQLCPYSWCDVNFLTQLCSLCRLQPESYLLCKRQLLTEYVRLGKLTLADSRKLLKIDVNKTRKIFDFLIAKGMVHSNTPPTTPPPPP